MKKYIIVIAISIFAVFVLSVSIVLMHISGFISEAVISKDYETITYNSKEYVRTDLYVDPPDYNDREDFTPHIEGEDFIYYLSPMFWNYVYVSESYPEYIWLETELDTLNGKPFKKYGELVIYKLKEETAEN